MLISLSFFGRVGVIFFSFLPTIVWAYPVDMDKLPNQGRNSYGCIVCHISPAGEEINSFGRDYRDTEHQYDDKLKSLDSDHDGFSNDQELRANPPANPGDPMSYPWNPPDPWAWGATLIALIIVVTGGFSFVLRTSRHSS